MSTPQGPQDPQQPGYGYPPPQQSGYGYPPPEQPGWPGYGYPPQQGYPPQPQPYLPSAPEPDWESLAQQREARSRRKKRLVITGSVLGGAALIAAAVFVAAGVEKDKNDKGGVVAGNGSPTPAASPATSGTGGPSASATPSPSASASSMRGNSVFTASTLPVNGHSFVRKTTSHESPCWKATESGLGPVLNSSHCTDVALATYSSGSDTVTVGVMAFPSAADAEAAAAAFKGRLKPLTGESGIPDFCSKVACAVTHAAHGRFVYSTTAGPNSGKAGDTNSDSIAAGQGLAAYALSRVTEMQ